MPTIKVGARGSDLSRAQAKLVIAILTKWIDAKFVLTIIETAGDLDPGADLADGFEQGVFTRAIERELMAGHIDLAVHSFKDLPLRGQEGIAIAAVPPRADPCDVLVVRESAYSPERLPIPLKIGAVVGTSSPRRTEQLLAARSDLLPRPIRGNVPTRLEKVRRGEFDAALLAAAGIARLEPDLSGLQVIPLDPERFVPSPAQGALAIQVRAHDELFNTIRAITNDPVAEKCVIAERRLLEMFGGGCAMPVGALVRPLETGYRMNGFYHNGRLSRWASLTTLDAEEGLVELHKQLSA